jgi:LysR family transcriptional activator of nhaA
MQAIPSFVHPRFGGQPRQRVSVARRERQVKSNNIAGNIHFFRTMAGLNYKHLHYFWVVAKTGGVARAAARLHVTPQSISGQLKLLEDSLGTALFRRAGRNLELTDAGRMALAYAEEIFPRGDELQEVMTHRHGGLAQLLRVGVADVVPKSIAFELLRPVLDLPQPMRIVCREWRLRDLLAELAVQRLDVVIADVPMPREVDVRAFSHPLGTCGIAFFAAPSLARRLKGSFPRALDSVPMLVPGDDAAVRPRLMQWLADRQVRPRIVGEFDDRALMHDFGQAGSGVFAAPAPLREHLRERYGVVVIGETADVVEAFYAISVERRVTAPAVLAMREAGKRSLFERPRQAPAARRRARSRPAGAARGTTA